MRSIVRAASFAGGFAALAIGVIGFAHTKAGRPLLALLPGAGRCPVGMDVKLAPEERERARLTAQKRLVGDAPAERARPALGFDLARATRADVDAWIAANRLSCKAADATAGVVCARVPGDVLADGGGDAENVTFFFDGRARLVAVDAARRALSPEGAARFVDARAKSIATLAGPPAVELGERTAEYLAPGKIATTGVEFRFAGYRAEIDATQMGPLGLLVREQYHAID